MEYSISQVSEMFKLPASTLRYYDKEGLFPDLKRKGNVRKFSENELEALRVIDCLKRSGLEIKDIKNFFAWCAEGPATYNKRLELFLRQRDKLNREIAQLKKTRAMLDYKCWYYSQLAANDATEEQLREQVAAAKMPTTAQTAYDIAHA